MRHGSGPWLYGLREVGSTRVGDGVVLLTYCWSSFQVVELVLEIYEGKKSHYV